MQVPPFWHPFLQVAEGRNEVCLMVFCYFTAAFHMMLLLAVLHVSPSFKTVLVLGLEYRFNLSLAIAIILFWCHEVATILTAHGIKGC